MSEIPGKNRRKDTRFNVQIQVDYQTKELFTSNYTMNISKGGLFIQTNDPLPISSEIHLELNLPQSEVTMEVTGRVVWTFGMVKGSSQIAPGMGIKFINFSRENKKQLEDYIDNLSSDTPRT